MDELSDEERVKFCQECQLKVYDLINLSSKQIEELVTKQDGQLCGQVIIREDNKVVLGKEAYEGEIVRGMIEPER